MSERVEASPKSVAQVLVDVSRDVGAVRKSDRNEQQRFMFRGIDAVMNAVWPALHCNGVFMQPEVLEIHHSTVETNKNKIVNVVRLKYQLTFHGPAGDTLPVVVWGEANDYGDKATAKAHSVALRTALLQALCLPTDELDPDAEVYEHQAPQQQTEQIQPAPQPSEEQIAAYRELSGRAQQAKTIDELQAAVTEAAKVPCLDPMAELLTAKLSRMLDSLTTVDDVKRLWRVASSAGVLHSTKTKIQERAEALKTTPPAPTPEEAQQAVQEQLGAEPVATDAQQ